MKAVVLAARKCRQLWHLTEDLPKPLILVANQPILDYIVDTLNRRGRRCRGTEPGTCPEPFRGRLSLGSRYFVCYSRTADRDGPCTPPGGISNRRPIHRPEWDALSTFLMDSKV